MEDRIRREPLLESPERSVFDQPTMQVSPYDVHYESSYPLQMRMSDTAESLAREVERSQRDGDFGGGPGSWGNAIRRAGRTIFTNLCLCRWPRASGYSMDISKWRSSNHQYQRAPPNTTLQEFLDMSNRESQAEAVVTVMEAPQPKMTRSSLFSDEPASAVQAELENGDEEYFEEGDAETAVRIHVGGLEGGAGEGERTEDLHTDFDEGADDDDDKEDCIIAKPGR